MKGYEAHRFFCLQCGHENLPIYRKTSHQHKKYHRKKLYCPYCKTEINHIELRSDEEVAEFKKQFEQGDYINEAKESLSFSGSAW